MTEQVTIRQLETYLWGAANFLRNKIDAGDYKGYIFPLVFLKRISDVYDEEYQKALDESDGDEEHAKSEINHQFKIPNGCHWNDLRNTSKNIGQKILKLQREIEKSNRILFGIFGDANWGNSDRLSDETLLNLIEHFSKIDLSVTTIPDDLMGTGYEFLIKKFADDSGHTAAEFYTNRSVVSLMTELLEPQPDESVYDPTCGTGGMLLECVNFLKRKGKDSRTLKLFGQEKNVITSGIARMNMLLHGFEDAKIARQDTLSHPVFVIDDELQKFDVILANPPYSIKIWNQLLWNNDPYGRNIYGTPPQSKADYAFIQHIVKSLSAKGRAAVLLPHGVLFRDAEAKIRKKLIEDDTLEAVIGLPNDMFYNSPMEACIMIFRRNKVKSRKKRVLFINAVDQYYRKNGRNTFTEKHITKIFSVFKQFKNIDDWKTEGFPGVISDFAYVATHKEIELNDYLLGIPYYTKYFMKNKIPEPKYLVDDWSIHQKKLSKSLKGILKQMEIE
jgi:type I restriction enzyme M protein